ncbi:hypothetical protein [Acinetobacter baumannii]|uniref:hypothetical protein n=1 Tax=Acinetobacter baumannii TaxID=470 RepID=UPI00396C481F
MQSCTLNWEIISRFISPISTFVIAFIVYQLWHKQKRKEVVATESKSIINDVFEMNKYFFEITHMNVKDEADLLIKMNDFRTLSYQIKAKLTFINNAIKNKDISNEIKKFGITNNKILDLFLMYETNKNRDLLDFGLHLELLNKDNNEIINFQNNISSILEICKEIAMYKIKPS